MNTLIIYASKHGTAEKCAAKLSEKLTGKVELHNIKGSMIEDFTQYDKVIIGGSMYAGKIQKEISEFCSKNLSMLKDKKIGLFICCMVKNSTESQINSSFPQELLNSTVVKESFGGEFRFKEMSLMEKAITKVVSKMLAKTDDRLGKLDMKKDISMISEENIDKFAQLMNNA